MRANTHPGDEAHVETSSSNETMDKKKLDQSDGQNRAEANRKLEKSGLTVDDIAEQSAYAQDQTGVTEQAANSDRNKKG
ncbi:MAG TPA: hypothetical protein VJQ56_06965 [Blastocatellia bacterium]|nr:hypothetical protein [Blastocatellia bacterium]